jgi:NDP-sugar pyrophosphorylase family protein
MRSIGFVSLFVAAGLSHAQGVNLDRCRIEAGKNDEVIKGADLIIEGKTTVERAVAVEGNVIIRPGASVKDAMALRGSVTVEAGATVHGSAIAVGGKVKVAPGGRVEGSQIALDDSLRIVGDDGKDVRISLSVGGKSLAKELLKPLLEKIHDCGVISLK